MRGQRQNTAERPVRPTPRQFEALRAIADHQLAHEVAPTFRELGEVLGIQINAVNDLLHALDDHGLVTWELHKARTLRLTQAGRDLLAKEVR